MSQMDNRFLRGADPLRIPPRVHVDANMHPWLYRHLHVFPLLFDQISLWAFNPRLHEEFNRAIHASDLGHLFLDDESPFQLGCSSEWIDRGSAIRNRTYFLWSPYLDGHVVDTLVRQRRVVVFDQPEAMRDRAWDLADRLADGIKHELGEAAFETPDTPDEGAVDSVEELALAAYRHSNLLLAGDREKLDRQLAQGTEAEAEAIRFQFGGALPPIFLQRPEHGYGERCADGRVLSCLYFDHFTKAQMVQRISAEAGNDFTVFVFPVWHRLLANGLALLSSESLFRGTPTPAEALVRDLAAPRRDVLLEALVERLEPGDEYRTMRSAELVDLLRRWRAVGGPAALRRLATALLSPDVGHDARSTRQWVSGVEGMLLRLVRDATEADQRSATARRLIGWIAGVVPQLVSLSFAWRGSPGAWAGVAEFALQGQVELWARLALENDRLLSTRLVRRLVAPSIEANRQQLGSLVGSWLRSAGVAREGEGAAA